MVKGIHPSNFLLYRKKSALIMLAKADDSSFLGIHRESHLSTEDYLQIVCRGGVDADSYSTWGRTYMTWDIMIVGT